MAEYSIAVRLRRKVTEAKHVSVPITPDLLQPDPTADGSKKLDAVKVFEAALKLGMEDSSGWESEGETELEIHPLQTPLGEKEQLN